MKRKAQLEIAGLSLSTDVLISNYAWIDKKNFSDSQLKALKEALTINVKKVGNYPGEAPGPLYTFSEFENLFGIPREYYQSVKKPDHVVKFSLSETKLDSTLKFNGTLRQEQQEALDSIAEWFKTNTGGMLKAPPGWGKTTFSCALIPALNVKTLVVVHKQFLMDQWEERIQQFLPEAKVGRVQGDTFDIEGKDIVLGMVQSISKRQYPDELYKWPGLFISDEVHRISARSWSPIPGKFAPRYRLGITATPRRKDGAEDVFFFHLGPIVFTAKEQRMTPRVRRVYTDFKIIATKRLNPRLITKPILLRFLCASRKRNQTIIDQLILSIKAGRRPLVLSERIEHLKDLMDMLDKSWTDPSPKPSMGLYIGGMKEEEYEKSKQATVMFATSQLISEGFDHPALDTLFMCTPNSDVEQQIGRICRPFEGKKDPVVVDIRDDLVDYCLGCASSRERLYEKLCPPPQEKNTGVSGTSVTDSASANSVK